MIIGIPVYDDVDMLDVTGPYEMFTWAGLDVEIVAEKAGQVKFRKGFKFCVEKEFKDAGKYDVLWVPGGDPDALALLMGDERRIYLDFLIRQSDGAKYVCSVCEGALLLGAAGLLENRTVTTHWQFISCLKRFKNVTPADGFPRFYLDGNVLTGGGISSGLDEALELIRLLLGTKKAQSVQRSTQYYPKPPVTSEIEPSDFCPVKDVTIPPRHA